MRTQSFVQGLRSDPSKPLLIACSLLVLQLLAIELCLRHVFEWVPEEYLLSGPDDDEVHVAHEVSRIARNSDENTFYIYLLGGSGAREVLLSDQEQIAAALSERFDRPIAFLNLGTNYQSLMDSLIISENLPDEVDFVAFIGLTPNRLSHELAHRSIPLRSSRLAALRSRYGASEPWYAFSSIYFLRPWFTRWFESRGLSQFAKPIHFDRLRYPPDLTHSLRMSKRRVDRLSWRARLAEQNIATNLIVLEEIVLLLKWERGGEVVLLEQPRSRVLKRIEFPVEGKYRQGLGQLAKRHGIEHWDFESERTLDLADFHNYGHINASGKRKFEAWFLSGLGALIEERAG